jgi:hypothetical protein
LCVGSGKVTKAVADAQPVPGMWACLVVLVVVVVLVVLAIIGALTKG